MHAATLIDTQKIEIKERAIPEPAQGEVILRTSFAGVCGSDVHIFHGTNPIATLPRVQGHEFCGQIHSVGAQVDPNFHPGTRVVVYPLVTCGGCEACCNGRPHVCKSLVVIGVNRDGGFAEYVRLPAANVVPIPHDLPDQVAVLSEPFSIGYHSLSRGGLRAEDRVLIIGAGPIGLYAALVARARGAKTVVCSEPSPSRQSVARGFGLEVVDPSLPDHEETFLNLSNGDGFSVVVETSGTHQGLETAQNMAAISGRIVLLGFPSGRKLPYDITLAIVKELEMIGSRVCPRDEFHETLSLLARLYRENPAQFDDIIGGIFALSDVAQAIEETAAATSTGKLLIDPRSF